jgi:hypothetical protein
MSFFGMSSEGKDAQKALKGNAQQSTDWAKQWGNNSQDQYTQAGDLRNEVLWNNRDVADNGMGTPQDAKSAGRVLTGDNSGYFDEQNGRLADLGDRIPDSGQVVNGVRQGVAGVRDRQSSNVNDWRNGANGQSTDAYNKVRANTQNYGEVMNKSSQDRADALSTGTNGTYDAMSKRIGDTDSALVGRNDSAYGGAKDLLTENSNRLTSAMDANGAAQMRASAPLMASAKARMRAAGVDPNSPEGASLMSRVDQTRAHAVEDNLANNISQQNQITSQKAQMGLDQEATDRGLAQDMVNQENSMAAKQNDLNRQDLNQKYDTDQQTTNTQFNNKNAADMGEYQDQRATNANAQQQQQQIDNSRANDTFQTGQMQMNGQQQDWTNRANVVNGQNGVSQQRVQDNNTATGNGMNWANAQFNAQQQGRNNTQQVWNSQNQNAQSWANGATQANNSAMQGNGIVYSNESANAGWGLKGLMGAAGAAGAAYLGK